MTDKIPTVPLPGSERHVMANARKLGQAAPEPTLQVTVLARRRTGAGAGAVSTLATTLGNSPPAARAHLDPAEFAARFGADPADLARIEAFAHTHGIDVVDVKPAERRVLLNGSVGALSAAFGVRLDDYVDPAGDRSFRGRSGPVHLPADLIDVVATVERT